MNFYVKLWLYLVANFLIIFGTFGSTIPLFISSKNEIQLATGIALIALTPIVLYYFNRNLVIQIMEMLDPPPPPKKEEPTVKKSRETKR